MFDKEGEVLVVELGRPAAGSTNRPCKGHVIDHIVLIACRGADALSNMQWQTVADAKAKDKWERKGCGK